jgi:glucose/arabinose dehydrogenase/cytochrome c2
MPPGPWLRLAYAAALAAGFLACLGLSYLAGKHGLIWRARAVLAAQWERIAPAAEGELIRTRVDSVLHQLEVTRLPLQRAWMLAEVGHHLVFSTPDGHILYLDGERVRDLGLAAPLNLAAMRAGSAARGGVFEERLVRVTDLLVTETAHQRYDLYVAHIMYDNSEACFRLAVHVRGLAISENGLSVTDPDWRRVFQTRDCFGPRPGGFTHVGRHSGGRLVRIDANTLVLSIGDFEMIGGAYGSRVYDDPNSDLGRLHLMPLAGGATRVLARGLRNPQGLLAARDGRLWETEHGPHGGDELNLVRAGADYGWPHVSYGASYGANTDTDWPEGARAGTHDGYERPRFSFTPSIGISNLIDPDPREFPNWDQRLLVASLRAQALYLLRLDGADIVEAEPISLGERLRDIISLADGRIAIATDGGDVLILANADGDQNRPTPGNSVITGLDALPEPPAEATAPHAFGARLFAVHCAQCHSVSGIVQAGPPLDGVLGRQVGGHDAFTYSEALTGRQQRWTRSRLRAFIADPQHTFPGTRMPSPTLQSENGLNALVGYLASLEPMRAREARDNELGVAPRAQP